MQVVAPKRAALAEANKKLNDANKKLESIRGRVKELNDRVASLEDSLMKVRQLCLGTDRSMLYIHHCCYGMAARCAKRSFCPRTT